MFSSLRFCVNMFFPLLPVPRSLYLRVSRGVLLHVIVGTFLVHAGTFRHSAFSVHVRSLYVSRLLRGGPEFFLFACCIDIDWYNWLRTER